MDVAFGDDAPIVGGAAGDGRDVAPPPDSAAARASAATLTRTAPIRVMPVAPAPAARHGQLRLVLGVVAVLAVLAGGGVARPRLGAAAVLRRREHGHVAIFQGVRGSVLGLPLQHVVEGSDIALTDLPEATRNTVQDGLLVTEGGLGGARARVGHAARGDARALPRADRAPGGGAAGPASPPTGRAAAARRSRPARPSRRPPPDPASRARSDRRPARAARR